MANLSYLEKILALTILLLPLVSLKEAQFKCHKSIDMVILLDSSGSITRKQFRMEKKFASDLIKHFEISKEKTNVALAAFSQYTRTTRTFQNDVSEELVSKAIGKLRYEGAASRLDLGFDVVKFSLFNTENGARVTNKGVKRVAVFLTDGYSTRGVEFTRDNAAALHDKLGVQLFSVGISGRVNKAELDELASKPRKTHQLFMNFPTKPFSKEQVEHFAKQICKA